MKRIITPLGFIAVLSVQAAPLDSLTKIEKARQLVASTKDFEREAQAIRFMTTDSPISLPKSMASCMEEASKPEIESYFSAQYADNMTSDELDKAIEFFQSKTGQSVTNIRLNHENDLFNGALKGIKVADENPHYPDQVQNGLDAFGKTSAGRFFTSDEIRSRPEVRSRISELRSAAFAKCFNPP